MNGLTVIHLITRDGHDQWMVVKRNEEPPGDYAEVTTCGTRDQARRVVRDAVELRASLAQA